MAGEHSTIEPPMLTNFINHQSSILNPHTKAHGIGVMLYHMTCIEIDNFIEMHDKRHTFLTVVDKTSVHRQVLYGVAICVRSFGFTTGDIMTVTKIAIKAGYMQDRYKKFISQSNDMTCILLCINV